MKNLLVLKFLIAAADIVIRWRWALYNHVILTLFLLWFVSSGCNNPSPNSARSEGAGISDNGDDTVDERWLDKDSDSNLNSMDANEEDSEPDEGVRPRRQSSRKSVSSRVTATATDSSIDVDGKLPDLDMGRLPPLRTVAATSAETRSNLSTSTSTASGIGAEKCIDAPSNWICDVELEVATLVSKERNSVRVAELRWDPKLSWIARTWSIEQGRRGIISHEWFVSGELKQRFVKKFNEDPRLSAENVAMIPCEMDAKATAASIMRSWMNSAGHRENILRTGQTRIGVGIVEVNGSCYGTQNFGF